MKSKIQLDNLELIVTSKNNKVDSFEGDMIIKELVKDYFGKPIVVNFCKKVSNKGITSIVNKLKTLNPGDKDYIMAALIEIRNDLNLRTEYNINE